MRYHATSTLLDYIQTNDLQIKSVAVVGGTSRDPEVVKIKELMPNIDFVYLGIDNPHKDPHFEFVDLNKARAGKNEYDLVLCSQVLEHLWNLDTAFNFLVSIVKPTGLLWINCPASNMAHGSPEYYSAGYSPEYLIQNLQARGHEILKVGAVGSRRYYYMTHILRMWATEKEHLRPVTKYNYQPGTFLGVTRKFLREIPGRLTSLLHSSEITDSIEYATESYCLSKPKAL
jgi:SAM-dependent methyltransferase